MAAKGLKRAKRVEADNDERPGLQLTEVCALLSDVEWRGRMARVAGATAGCLLSLAVIVLFLSVPLSGENDTREGGSVCCAAWNVCARVCAVY